MPAPDPTKFEAVIFPDATILLPVKVPATVNEVKVPRLVIFVCIGLVTIFDDGTVPTTFDPIIPVNYDPLPVKYSALIFVVLFGNKLMTFAYTLAFVKYKLVPSDISEVVFPFIKSDPVAIPETPGYTVIIPSTIRIMVFPCKASTS